MIAVLWWKCLFSLSELSWATVYKYVCVSSLSYCWVEGNFLLVVRRGGVGRHWGWSFSCTFFITKTYLLWRPARKEKVWQPLSTIDKKEIGMITFPSRTLRRQTATALEFYIQAKSSFMCSHALQLNRENLSLPKKTISLSCLLHFRRKKVNSTSKYYLNCFQERIFPFVALLLSIWE